MCIINISKYIKYKEYERYVKYITYSIYMKLIMSRIFILIYNLLLCYIALISGICFVLKEIMCNFAQNSIYEVFS